MTRRSLAAALALFLLASSGCSVNVSQSSSSNAVAQNQCSADSDCGDGECWNGVCVAHQGALSTLLLALTPPVSAPISGIGGLGFLELTTGLARSNEQHDIDLDGASNVHGYIRSACPFEVTLTPQAESYGLPTATYVTHTSSVDAAAGACRDKLSLSGPTQEFVLNVPPGTFDVYINPSTSMVGSDGGASTCDVVPEVFPGLVRAQAGVSCVAINQAAPKTLDVRIPWPNDTGPLDGWTLDVRHPITGQVLSQPSEALKGAPAASDGAYYYSRLVTYSPVATTDPSVSGQELLRLSPPDPSVGPVLQFSIAAAIASSPPAANGPQKAVLPKNIGPFPPKVTIDGWVRRARDFAKGVETPVPSTVTFAATSLDMPSGGIFASYSTTAMVGADGHLVVQLLPGDYRVRVVPVVEQSSDAQLASQEWTWSIPASNGTSGAIQAGRQLLVENAATVSGKALSASGAGIAGASVQALAASVGTRRCAEADATACAAQPVGVLEMSLAESAYVPRTASALTQGDGRFALTDVDCGGCDMQDGASFDVVAQPADGTRIPWLVWPQVIVSADIELPTARATLPIIQRGKVEVPSGMLEPPTVIPGTLIRAYVIRDASGAPIADPTGLPSCSSGTYTGAGTSTRCIRSALQVAETRADSDGNYELSLPATVGATPE